MPPVKRPTSAPRNGKGDEDVVNMKKRLNVLEGSRKAQYESSQSAMRQNKDEAFFIKLQNKKLGNQLGNMRRPRTATSSLSSIDFGAEDTPLDISVLDLQLQEARKEFNMLRCNTMARNSELEDKSKKLRDLEMMAQKPNTEHSPAAKNIRGMESRLGRVIIKYNEAQGIRKTYQQIVKRLKEERIGFDNQISAIERTLRLKERDYEELLLMSHDASHARDAARSELSVVEHVVNEQRKMRHKDSSEKRKIVQATMDCANEQMEKKRLLMSESSARQRTRIAEKANMVVNEIAGGELLETTEEENERKVREFEEGFRRIKEATGVTDVNDVLQRFFNQEDTLRHLNQLRQQAMARIEQLNEDKVRERQHLDDLAYQTSGDNGGRHVIDEFEQHVFEATTKLDRNRAKHERLEMLLVDTRAGISHLAEKLEVMKIDPTQPIQQENLAAILIQCEKRVLEYMEDVHDSLVEFDARNAELPVRKVEPVKQLVNQRRRLSVSGSALTASLTKEDLLDSKDPGNASPFNVRIKFYQEKDSSTDESGDDEMDDVPDRELMKRMATIMVEKASRRTRKKKSRHSGGGDTARSSPTSRSKNGK